MEKNRKIVIIFLITIVLASIIFLNGCSLDSKSSWGAPTYEDGVNSFFSWFGGSTAKTTSSSITTCSDTCSTSTCDGTTYIECITGSNGCKQTRSQGQILGKCSVECLTDNDCTNGGLCTENKCTIINQNEEKQETQGSVVPIQITPQRVEAQLGRSASFKKMPKDSAGILGFYDDDKQVFIRFFVIEGGQVILYNGQAGDVELDVYYKRLVDIENAPDFCTAVFTLAKSQDFELQINDIFATIGKYGYLRNCN
jgi:hypothetical protein